MPSKTTLNFYYTYVLKSLKDGKRYIGYTEDLRRRMEEHHNSKCFSTSHRLPVELVYYEACRTESGARAREKYFKSTPGRRFLAIRLRHDQSP